MGVFHEHEAARSTTRLPRRRHLAVALLLMLITLCTMKIDAQNLDAAIDVDPATDQLTGDDLATDTDGRLPIYAMFRLKPNFITLASSELAPNMFGACSELVRS